MALSSYVLPLMGSGALFAASYMLGRFGYSVGWILIFVGLGFVKTKLWKQREQRLLVLRTAALREKEVVLANLQDLPAWVQFPDTERVEWINKVIDQLWPYIGEYTKQFMTELVEPQVKAALPGPFKSFRFVQVDMGDIPLRVGGIKVYTDQVGRDRVIMDMNVAYAGDSNFDIQVGMFKAGLNEVQFQGKLRVVLKPLLPYPPMVGGVSAYFMEPPTMDFNLTGLGEMIELPGLLGAIRTVIDAQVASLCVLPNEIVVSLAPNLDLASLYFPEPDGVVRIHVVQAKNLMDLDTFLKGKSDPYALVKVGSQTFKTKTVDDNLNPEWNEIFEAVVDQASGQKFRMELYDEDIGSNDEELGRLTLDLSTVRDKGIIDKWYALEACKKGDVYVKLYWMNLCKSPADLDSEAEQWEKEWQEKIHPALVSVYVDNVSNLPYPKAKVEPSPFITLTLGKETKETVPKVNTVNPLFQQKFQFWCHSVESQNLKVEAVDSGTKRPLGDVTIGINRLLTEPKMELYQHTFHLTLGTHQSPIVLTVRLRALKCGMGRPPSSTAGKAAEKTADDHVESAVVASDASAPTDSAAQFANGVDRMSIGGGSRKSGGGIVGKLTSKTHVLNKETEVDGEEAPLGRLQLGVRYSFQTNKLVVNVYKATGLRSVDKAGSASPYVKVKLISGDGHKTKQKTNIAEDTLDPLYDAQFEFDVHHTALWNHKLLIQVTDSANYGLFTKPPVLGQVMIDLNSMNEASIDSQWFDLEARPV